MKQKFDSNWKFRLGDLPPKTEADGWGGAKARAYSFGAVKFDLDDSQWRDVNIPHDFVVEGDYTRGQADSDMRQIPEMESINSRHFAGGSLAGSAAWYRKHFEVPESMTGRRVYLHFDGIYRNSTVYLNEYYVCSHKSGYTGFCIDITNFVNYGLENVLAVRVESTGREGWWYEGGGIYRHVWIEYKRQTHIVNDGVFVYSDVSEDMKSARIHIDTEIENKELVDKTIVVKTVISDKSGKVIGAVSGETQVNAWDSCIFRQETCVSDIHLWDICDPYLYSAKTEIYCSDELLDAENVQFGIRHCRFDADKGFFLNGRHIKIQGVCCHHDHAGVGIGIPDSVWEYRVDRLKEMGANAYRSAHYPPPKELLDICDRVGMLMFSETRRMSSAEDDLDALRFTIRRGRNHPSVFLWGIGNEEIFSQNRPETARTTVTMKAEINKLDKTRPITSAVVCWNGKERFNTAESYIDVTKHLDIMGFNYCMTAWDDYHKRMPEQPIIITEASVTGSTRGCYSTDENMGQYYALDENNYDKCKNKRKAIKKDMGEEEWKYCAERDYIAGIFVWTGMDYRGEPTPLSYPAIYSQMGILDSCGFKKDIFYYYKSQWSDDVTLHVFPHWNSPLKDGEPLTVYCYGNVDETELFVNGKSYGRKVREKHWYLSWENVEYESGELKAVGYKDGEEVIADTVKTTDVPYAVKLMPYKSVIMTEDDAAVVNVCAVDKDGRIVPIADNEIHFTVEGAGEFLGCGNGNPGSHENDKVPVRRLFNGLAQVLVKPEGTGDIYIKAEAAGLLGGQCKITIRE